MDFIAKLKSGEPLIFDGAMGTMLGIKGLPLSGGANNLDHPQVVGEVHREYLEAGSNCLITNTLTMNRIYVESHDLDVDWEKANEIGAQLAREAAGNKAFVFGDIGPTGQMLAPLGEYEPEVLKQSFQEQAQILAANKVDGFIIETMFDVEEALLALAACKEVSDLPVVFSMTFATTNKGGRTIMGNSSLECAQRAEAAGAAVAGCNCGDLAPAEMAVIVANMSGCGLPIIVQPNAGKPRLVGTQTVYDLPPAEFAAGIKKCFEAGARIAGGCCGTSPDHLAAIAAIACQ